MRIETFKYLKPHSLNEACAFLAAYGGTAKILAGGTDVLVALKQKRIQPEVVVDIRGLEELSHLAFEADKCLRIGSLVTVDRVAMDEQIQKSFSVVSEAALSIGALQHRTMGTVGGNTCLETRCWFYNQSSSWRKARAVCSKLGGDICHVVNKGGGVCHAVFSADLAAGLVAMDAEVVLTSPGEERVLPLNDFYTGDGIRPHVLRADEIVREIRIAASPYAVKSAYLKKRVRGAIDFAQAGVAVALWLDKHTSEIKKARIVLGSLGTRPIRVTKAEEMLLNREINEKTLLEIQRLASKAASPVKNVFGATVSYRREIAGTLAGEGIEQLLGLNKGN